MTARLRTEDRLARPDDVYEILIEAHRDLDPEQGRLLDAKLILLLANHIGDQDVLAEAIGIARQGIANGASEGQDHDRTDRS